MGWFDRRKPDNPFGYEDRAALKGVGGYEPADAADAAPEWWRTNPADPPGPGTGGGSTSVGGVTSGNGSRSSGAGVGLGCVLSLLLIVGVPSYFLSATDSGSGHGTAGVADEEAREQPVPSPRPEVTVPAAVEGWQPVVGGDGAYAYDVPPAWSPSASVLHGWIDEPGLPDVRLSTSAFLGEGHCAADPDRVRAGGGLSLSDRADPGRAAEELANAVARHAYTPDGGTRPDVTVGDPVATTVSLGDAEREAKLRFAEVAVRGDGPCLPTSALVGALAVTPAENGDGAGQSPVLVVYSEQGTDAAPGRDELTRVLESLRWVPEEDRRTVSPSPSR